LAEVEMQQEELPDLIYVNDYDKIAKDIEEEMEMMEDDERAMRISAEDEEARGEEPRNEERTPEGRWRRRHRKKRVSVLRVEQRSGVDVVKAAGGWKQIRFTVDSGAGETVMNKHELPGIPIVPSPGSKRGQHYITASEERIPNEGEQHFLGCVQTWNPGRNGRWTKSDNVKKAVNVQIADVSHPLMAVKRLCLANHRVIFDEEGSCAVNKLTGEVLEIKEEGGEYVMDMWVLDEHTGFQGQGR